MLPETPATTLASVLRRFGARLFDNAIIFVAWALLLALTGHLSVDTMQRSTSVQVAIWLTAVAYEIWLISQTGQTIGKRLLSIQAVDATTGAIPTMEQSVRRAVPVIIQAVPFFGIVGELLYVPALWHPRRQGVHDRLANTVVVDRRALIAST